MIATDGRPVPVNLPLITTEVRAVALRSSRRVEHSKREHLSLLSRALISRNAAMSPEDVDPAS
jgi:hypothetical protein